MNSVRVLRTQCAGHIRTAISDNVVASDVIRVIGPANIRAASIAVVVGLVAVIIEPAHTRGGVRPSPGRQSSTAATSAGLAILGADRSRVASRSHHSFNCFSTPTSRNSSCPAPSTQVDMFLEAVKLILAWEAVELNQMAWRVPRWSGGRRFH